MTKRKTLEAILFRLGFGNRRECRRLVREGWVSLQGTVCDDPFAEVDCECTSLSVGGEEVPLIFDLYLVMHKPDNLECSHRPGFHGSVYSLFPERYVHMGLQSAGRLDVDTTGLLLFSNDGQFIHHVESPRKGLHKCYWVDCLEKISNESLEHLRSGVLLYGEKKSLVPLDVKQVSETQIHLLIGEGRYHQVKRMLAAVGCKVSRLHRHSVGDLILDASLKPGDWRMLTPAEMELLKWSQISSL